MNKNTPREMLIAQVCALAHTAKETWPEAAVVLLSLQAAMLNDEVLALADVTADFSQSLIERITRVQESLS